MHTQIFHVLRVCIPVPGPRRVEQLQVVNVSSSQVWLSWLVQAARHTAVSRVHVSLLPSDGSQARTAVLNTSTSEHTFRSAPALCCKTAATPRLSTLVAKPAASHFPTVWRC